MDEPKYLSPAYNIKGKPILIYFETRGAAQVIRALLLYLEVYYDEIFVDRKGYLDPYIIKKYRIDMKFLPYLVHEGFVVFGIFPMMKYLCTIYDRMDLLGKNVVDKLSIIEIMVKEAHMKNTVLHCIFRGLKYIKEKNLGDPGKYALSEKITVLCLENLLFKHLNKLFEGTKSFLFGYITIVDFILYEKCFYCSKSLISKQPRAAPALEYVKFFYSTEFFKKKEKELNKYKVFFPEVNEEINNLIRYFWMNDPIFYNK